MTSQDLKGGPRDADACKNRFSLYAPVVERRPSKEIAYRSARVVMLVQCRRASE